MVADRKKVAHQEMVAQHHGIPLEYLPLDRSQILHALRGAQQDAHRHKVFTSSALGCWINTPFHEPVNFDTLSGLRLEDADGSCNRTAPIFILGDSASEKNVIPRLAKADVMTKQREALVVHLHNYIYERWFRPYKSEIDRGQFLTKINVPGLVPLPSETCSPYMVDLVRRMSANNIARIRDTKSKKLSREVQAAGQVFYHLQPRFEAIAVSMRASNFDYEAPEVAHLPVLIVRTGIEEGLSAPITFDSVPVDARVNTYAEDGILVAVETRLDTAITFLMELEQRETEAFDPLPDLIKSTQDMSNYWAEGIVASTASGLGWDASTMGPLSGPSSRWGTPGKYPGWPDRNQKLDQRYADRQETICRNARSQVVSAQSHYDQAQAYYKAQRGS